MLCGKSEMQGILIHGAPWPVAAEDKVFIALSRTAMPRLMAALRVATRQLDKAFVDQDRNECLREIRAILEGKEDK
jgi:hypothetical protein